VFTNAHNLIADQLNFVLWPIPFKINLKSIRILLSNLKKSHNAPRDIIDWPRLLFPY
jgi:hypothetical protein